MRRGLRFEGVAVAGIGMIRFGMMKDRPAAHLARDAGLLALHDAGMTLADIDEAFVAYITPGSMLGVKAMKELGLTGLPVNHTENASATGLVAFRDAAWAVASGRADVAMAIGFDKFTDMVGGGGGGSARDRIDAPILPAAYFALWAQRRMHERGTAVETFARIAAKNWNCGAACPTAHRQTDHVVTAEEVLASALQSESYSRGHTFVGPVVGPSTMTSDTARECYEAAGIGPEDVSVAYCHDAFVNEELEYYELLGFCPAGDGDKLVADGETGPGGRIPFNTDGGLIARGHPGGPTGLAQIHEAVQQLRGDATGRQVEGARVALAHLVGGGSVCTVNLLDAVD